ncbi:hypothetical protein [Haloferax sp. YSMS24]|uniref:hypothetical protein n=1 Tax=Haloferax sp. YSMS24 TaxID=3388425 RepID=UPI00398CDF04
MSDGSDVLDHDRDVTDRPTDATGRAEADVGKTDTLDIGSDREAILALLEDGIREAHRKVENGRVYDPENEKVRIKWIRVLAYAAGQYRQLKRDEELDAMKRDLEALKEELHGPPK